MMYGVMIICRACGCRKEIKMEIPFILKTAYCPQCKTECDTVALPRTYITRETDTTIQVESEVKELQERVEELQERVDKLERKLKKGLVLLKKSLIECL